jgi:hypothetical protein
MKKFIFILTGLILFSLAWIGFVREPLAPIPVICSEISEEVDLKFSINTMDYTGLELSMNDKVEGKGMYVQFKMANVWKTGRPGLVLNGIKPNKNFKNGMTPKEYLKDEKRKEKEGKDFSDFMIDKKGKSVTTYTFKQTLVEGENGQTFMRMIYDGPEMDMIQTLEIPHPITIPTHISGKFAPKKIIQFQPGTITLDKKIKGFFIPVVVK